MSIFAGVLIGLWKIIGCRGIDWSLVDHWYISLTNTLVHLLILAMPKSHSKVFYHFHFEICFSVNSLTDTKEKTSVLADLQ